VLKREMNRAARKMDAIPRGKTPFQLPLEWGTVTFAGGNEGFLQGMACTENQCCTVNLNGASSLYISEAQMQQEACFVQLCPPTDLSS